MFYKVELEVEINEWWASFEDFQEEIESLNKAYKGVMFIKIIKKEEQEEEEA